MSEDPTGITISTHVLDSSGGGGRSGVTVEVVDQYGTTLGTRATDETGRIATLAEGLSPGPYTIRWKTGGSFVTETSVIIALTEVRHYHVPLLASDHSTTVYLGA